MEFKLISDKAQWEEFVTSTYPTSFFQSWNWGEFQSKLNNEVVRYGVFIGSKMVAAMQGTVIRAKRGKYMYIRNGPVLDWSNDKLVEFTINSLKQVARESNLWHIRISPHINEKSKGHENLLKHNFPISPMSDVDALDTWILDITQSEEEILANMRKSTRYDIRKAKKEGIEIIKTKDPEKIDLFYPIYEDTIKRQNWNGYTKDFIKTQFETFAQDDNALLYLAKYKDQYIAGSIFVFFGDSSNYHYSGSLTEFRKIPSPSLIQWENIIESKKRGLKRYNFWGIAPENKPDHPWKGLSFFKMGFGGYAERWLPTRDIPVSPLYWLTNLFERYDKYRKGY